MAETATSDDSAKARRIVELQAEVVYHNVDRTLATWTRTALALIVFGIAVDRFGLLMNHPPWHGADLNESLPNPLSSLGGVVLVALGVLILLATGFRFPACGVKWHRLNQRRVWFHNPWLAFTFAMLMAAFGIALLVVLCVFRQ
jgi:uncharacterized membrane protein YidH (DUF202 family)